MNFITKFIVPIFWALISLSLVLFISCDEFASKDFEISSLDASACEALVDTVSNTITAVSLTDFKADWADTLIYDASSNTYRFVPEILDSLAAHGLTLTDSPQKFRLVTVSAENESYYELNTNLNQLVFFFDRNVDVNIIKTDGTIITSGNPTIPLETTGGCVKFDEKLDMSVPVIQARISLSIPESRTLVKIIKNEQTGASTFHVAIM